MYQQQVLQIGAYSQCEVRRNVLSDGPANGVIVLDSADTLIADNVIARVDADGIYANLRDLAVEDMDRAGQPATRADSLAAESSPRPLAGPLDLDAISGTAF